MSFLPTDIQWIEPRAIGEILKLMREELKLEKWSYFASIKSKKKYLLIPTLDIKQFIRGKCLFSNSLSRNHLPHLQGW